jgi:Secretion system C-terminal sorting domain/Beta-propeller repeat
VGIRYSGPPGNGHDNANTIKVDLSGNVYVTGFTGVGFYSDYTTIKYNSSGTQQWLTSYSALGSSSEDARSIALDDLGNVYITGYSSTDTTLWDYATMKYVQSVNSVDNSLPNIPGRFVLEQNFPNPFNPSTTIHFSVPSSEFVTLKVFDVLGNEVATLVNEEKPAGFYEVNFNAAGLSSGIYFYKLKAGSFVETKKMLLIK